MRFLKVNPDLSLNVEHIVALRVTGVDRSCRLEAITSVSGTHVLSYHKSFSAARTEHANLIERLEGEQ